MLTRSKETVADFLEYDEDSYLAPVEPGPPPEIDTFEATGPASVEERQTELLEAPAPLAPGPPVAAIGGPLRSVGVLAARRGRTVALAALGGTACTVVALVALSLGRGTPERPHPLAAKATAAAQPTPAEAPSRRLAEPAERRQAAARQLRHGRVRRASRRRAAKRRQRRGARSTRKLAITPAPVRTNAPAAPPAPVSRPTLGSPPPAAPRSVAEAEFGIEGR
ncbi:MAG: hypothetical protein LC777_11885 [Actinobacteria bacterium]|nr:hypothetical protein [Actinomycetota bacterium]